MQVRTFIKNINSKYVYDGIFKFAKDINFKLKLFQYSKKFQKIFNLRLFNYQKAYLQQFNINLDKYLFTSCIDKSILQDKNYLKNIYKKDLLKYGINNDIFQKYIIDYYQNYLKNQKLNEYEKEIDIFSPIFDLLSKCEFFGKIFSININILLLLEFENDYIETFNNLNKIKTNYSINYKGYKGVNTIHDLKKIGILFNKLNKLSFLNLPSIRYQIQDNSILFLDKLFSLKDIKNLKYLNIELQSNNYICYDTLNDLNTLDSLEELRIYSFKLDKKFILNLKQLKKLYIRCCENITFSKDVCSNLRILHILLTKIVNDGIFLSFPNLEELKLKNTENFNAFHSVIDFKNLNNLKKLYIEIRDFLNLENSFSLENIKIFSLYESKIDKEIEIKMLKKIILLTNLKEVSFELISIGNDDISKISGVNNSITKLNIIKGSNIILNNLLAKFPNLSELSLDTKIKKISSQSILFEMKEN